MRKIINSKTKQYETVSTDEWTLDDEPTAGSFNGITSDGVAKAIEESEQRAADCVVFEISPFQGKPAPTYAEIAEAIGTGKTAVLRVVNYDGRSDSPADYYYLTNFNHGFGGSGASFTFQGTNGSKTVHSIDGWSDGPSEAQMDAYKESMHVTNGGILQNMPSIGSVVYVDKTNGDKYFLDPAKYPVVKATAEGLNAVGVVADVDGRKVMVLHKDESGDLPFASKLLFKLSGFKIDGSGNSIAMQQYNSSGTAIDVGTYDDSSDPADSLEAFVEGFDTWLRANPTVEGALTYNWHCELMNDASGTPSAFLVIDSYTSYRQNSSPVKSGATGTFYMWQWANQTTDRTMLLRNNGSSVYYAGWNKERLIEWFSDPSNASISPTDDPNGAGLLNKADFEGSSYPTVKAYYNNDYSEYMEAMMMKWPSTTGSQAYIYGTGKDISNALASIVVKNIAGEDTYVFDGAKYSHDRTVTLDAGVTCDGFGADGWFMPDVVQAFRMFSRMKTDGSDPVNASMVAIGSTARSLSVPRWLASRCSSANPWHFGRPGYCNTSYFPPSLRCCSVSLLEF